MPAAKKTAAKPAKAAPAKAKAAPAKAPAKAKAAAPASGKYTKTQLLNDLATATSLNRKEVDAVLNALADVIAGQVGKKGAGEFTLPGLLKIKTVHKPAQPAKKNVPNPFKPGETMNVPAKPASSKVKVLPLKKLKDMVA